MKLKEYQDFVETTWIPADLAEVEELRIVTGIFGELGEVAELIKKWHRGDNQDPQLFRERIKSEIGDVQYYIAKLANFYDIDLTEVLIANAFKLENRKNKGTIKGSGEDR